MNYRFEDYEAHQRLVADAVVIGAGAGGAAAAAALSERGLRVIVLEAGRHWKPSEFKQDSVWAYRNLYAEQGTRVALGNAVLPVPGGRGVGGSTLINSAICFRTPEPVMTEWAERYGCHRLASAAFSPHLDRVWQTIGVSVNPVSVQKHNNLIFKHGAEKLGLNGAFLPRSAPGCTGCGVCMMGCPTGGKWSVDRTFLAEAQRTGLCDVYADCEIRGLDTKAGRVVAARGVTIHPDTLEPWGTFEVQAPLFVLSAGPVGSPRLLLREGLASADVCGQNLHVHPANGMLGRFDHEIRPWEGVTQGYYVDRWQEGFLLQTYTTSPDQTYLSMPYAFGGALLELVRDLRFMGMAGPLVHDQDSVGSVGAGTLSYHIGDGDRRRLLAGMRLCARVLFAAGAREVYSGVVGSKPIRSEAEIDATLSDNVPARLIYLYASHPMGTCRMGDDPDASVVDPDGRVWGWENLYVADASVLPTSLGVNPQVTTMAIGLVVGAAAASGAHA